MPIDTYTETTSTGAGPYSYNFTVLKPEFLIVEVDGVVKTLTTHYTVGVNGVTFTTGNHPPANTVVTIKRDSQAETALVEFTNTSTITESSLDLSYDHNLHLGQELFDLVGRCVSKIWDGVTNAFKWDFKGYHAKNVGGITLTDDLDMGGNVITNTGSVDNLTLVSGATGATGPDGVDGADGSDGAGTEYIFAVTADSSTTPSAPDNSWGFDAPSSPWYDGAPSVTTSNKALWRAQRSIEGTPATGSSVSDNWSVSTVVGRFGDTGETGPDGADGADGVNARVVNLSIADQTFEYNTNGTTPSPVNAVVTGSALNTSGTVYYDFIKNDTSVQNTTSTTYTYAPPSSYADMPEKLEVQIREGAYDGNILARDQISVLGLKAGTDAITLVVSNESHTLPKSKDGVITYTGSGTTIEVWEGTTQISYDDSNPYNSPSFRITPSATNITVGSGSTVGNSRKFADHSSMTNTNASIAYSIVVKNSSGIETTFVKTQSFGQSVEGSDGSTGPAGTNGATWLSGTSTPASGLGTDGDFYLDTDDNKIYKKASGSWSEIADISAGTWGTIDGTLTNQSDLNTALAAKATTSSLTTHTGDTSNPHSVVKADVGLGNVDNTSDANKPVSTATQTALDAKSSTSHTHSNATTSASGFMSATDKTNLEKIPVQAKCRFWVTLGSVTLASNSENISSVTWDGYNEEYTVNFTNNISSTPIILATGQANGGPVYVCYGNWSTSYIKLSPIKHHSSQPDDAEISLLIV